MVDLPSGTVTFLFTDIEGSTRLWERDPSAMGAAVERHDAQLAKAITAHQGVLYKHIGDAVQAAFPTAADALAAAVAAQSALSGESWPETGPLRVRMALHLGEATPDARGDYHQVPALNRLARLLAAGHGGQILVSDAVRRLAEGTLPEGVGLKDLGRHRLRDLLEPELISQLVIAGLPAHFPPLKSLEGHATNLPIQPTPLIGREAELAAIGTLLRQVEVRLVTLTGVGGTGKTRLAIQLGADLLEAFADGVFFVDLAPLTDPTLVLSQIAATLGVRETGDRSLREAVHAYLAGKQVLLIIDNFEHVLEAAPVLAELMAASAGPKVLVTSRAPLHLRGEREYLVPPLPVPDGERLPPLEQLAHVAAVELFLQRAQAVQPGFVLDQQNARVVVEICTRLDGLPLAIELAAARVKLLPPAALLSRLERRLSMLTGGARDLPARQRTLRDTIGWSHDLLSPEEQTLFRRLAVFAGGTTLEAVEAVANPDSALDVLGSMTELVDQSLLSQEGGAEGAPRFRMLETIREFGLEQLAASGDEAEVRRRHAHYFLTLAETLEPRLNTSEQAATLVQLEIEHPNLRSVLEWARVATNPFDAEVGLRLAETLFGFWQLGGYLREGFGRLEDLLAQTAATGRSQARGEALTAAGAAASYLGDYARARGLLEEAASIATEQGDDRGLAAALYWLGLTGLFQGELGAARSLATQALEMARRLNDLRYSAEALLLLGATTMSMGDFASARTQLSEALTYGRTLGGLVLTIHALLELASVDYREGNYETARAQAEEALVMAQGIGDKGRIGMALGLLAEVAWAHGDYGKAHARAEESLPVLQEGGRLPQIAWAQRNLAYAALGKGDIPRAATLFQESLRVFSEHEVRLGIASCVAGLGNVALQCEQPRLAARLFGAVNAMLDTASAQFAPADQNAYQRGMTDAQAALGPQTFSDEWKVGQELNLDQAVQAAMAVVGEAPTSSSIGAAQKTLNPIL